MENTKMLTKTITPEIFAALSSKTPADIPQNLICTANALGIKGIYFLGNQSIIGCYGNIVIVLQNGRYVDFQCPENIEAIIGILSQKCD